MTDGAAPARLLLEEGKMVKLGYPWIDNKLRLSGICLLSLAFVSLFLLPQPALAGDPHPQPNLLFNVKLSYTAWDLGTKSDYIDGFEICGGPPRPWPWPPGRGPRPWFDFRFSYYEIHEDGLDRAIPLELGLRFPLSRTSRVTPYLGGGLGYYLLDGDSPKIQNELGVYGVLGADIRLGDRWGLSIEGAYREVGGDLDLGGPAVKAGLGFSFN
jgi:outer membrane protein with beta-barrel domain